MGSTVVKLYLVRIECNLFNTNTSTSSVLRTSNTNCTKPALSMKINVFGAVFGRRSDQANIESMEELREIHAQGYKPEEIQVSIGNGMITVVGTQEQRPENGFRTLSFTKKIKIPLFNKPDSIVWALNEATGSLDVWSN